MSARTYADLDQIVTDLPAARADVVPPASKINGLAIASLACGLAQFVCGPLATIPAIVFGHVARHLACTWLGGGVQGHLLPAPLTTAPSGTR